MKQRKKPLMEAETNKMRRLGKPLYVLNEESYCWQLWKISYPLIDFVFFFFLWSTSWCSLVKLAVFHPIAWQVALADLMRSDFWGVQILACKTFTEPCLQTWMLPDQGTVLALLSVKIAHFVTVWRRRTMSLMDFLVKQALMQYPNHDPVIH